MNQLESWVEQISHWYETRKHDQDKSLQYLILSAPDSILGPAISELQSKAIACWLDGCLRVFHSLRYREPSVAYQYLQLASSKLQACASHTQADLELKDWSMKRLQHLTVLALEFCNQQQQSEWQKESHLLIETHVLFMTTQGWNEIRKHDQGSHLFH